VTDIKRNKTKCKKRPLEPLEQGCRRDDSRPDFLSPSPFFPYLLLKPTQKGDGNPRKSHPFYKPALELGFVIHLKHGIKNLHEKCRRSRFLSEPPKMLSIGCFDHLGHKLIKTGSRL
jgi:hypothetical protein